MGAGVPQAAGRDQVRRARNAVYVTFFAAGFIFTSWASRIPQIRAGLHVTPGVLGLILLSGSAGALAGTTLSGLIVGWLGETRTLIVMSWTVAAGLAVVAGGLHLGIPPVAAGLLLFGFGNGAWDVAMNIQGAAVERLLGRAILPRFHAGWSIGTVAGAAAGSAMIALGVPVTAHLLAAALAVAVAVPAAARGFLPSTTPARRGSAPRGRAALASWAEPRTVLIGLFVLCMAFTEGTANDWLGLSVIDGYHTAAAVGTAVLAVFLAAMTAGRWWGPRLIDRYGRVRVLRSCAAVALAGLLLIVFGRELPAAVLGAVLLGLGTSLGFPVGLSSAADDPAHAAARVSTSSSIGYLAFIAGPPVIGFLGDRFGVLHSLLLAGAMLTAAIVLVRATAPLIPAGEDGEEMAAPLLD
jgi:predicted MFS family arabinose efflux permease